MIFWLKGVRTLAFALPLYYKDIFVEQTVMLRFALIRHSVLRAEDVFDTDRVTLRDFRINFRSGALDVINDHTVANKFGWFRRHILKLLQIVFGVQWVLGISRAHGFEFPRLWRRLIDVCVRQVILGFVETEMQLAGGWANDIVVLVNEFGFICFLFSPHFRLST